jgi:glucosamine-6-phosphate deaminase
LKRSQLGTLRIESYVDNCGLGNAAADKAANEILRLARDRDSFGVIFATGASQLETLRHLRERADLPWHKIIGFHMDEYVGMTPDHRASFRGYLRKELPQSKMKAFYELDGTSSNPDEAAERYAARLREVNPSLCLLGIGENGHLAFNDPWEADFADPRDVRLVNLDDPCREQQYAEGWFDSFTDVPLRALTLTIPPIMRVPMLVASVPGERKAAIVKKVFEAPITPDCPATILRTHPNATLYLDTESSAGITSLLHE